MDRDLVALLGFVGMFALMAIRVPIGIAMGIAGVGGFAALSGLKPGLNLLANVPLSVLTDYNLSVIPMFILMGAFASRSGMSTELFAAGRAWLATCAAACDASVRPRRCRHQRSRWRRRHHEHGPCPRAASGVREACRRPDAAGGTLG